MTVQAQRDFFGLFGLTPAFRLDESTLDSAYREVQAQVHPDRYAHLSDTEKRVSMQWATRVNEAYRTLRTPLLRACHLLELNGVDPGLETNTAMSPAFLMEQLEWREAVQEARAAEDVGELETLHQRLRQESRGLVGALAAALDERQAFEEAAELVRRMKFLEKLQHEIDDALEALES
jgi:molecular chaperone HscB